MTKLFMRRCRGLILGLGVVATMPWARASINIGRDRLFRLDFGAKSAVLMLLTKLPVPGDRREVRVALELIRGSCEVLLSDPTRFGAQFATSAAPLSIAARTTLWELRLESLPEPSASFSAEDAWAKIRAAFETHRNQQFERYTKAVEVRGIIESGYALNEQLAILECLLNDQHIDDHDILSQALRWHETAIARESNSIDLHHAIFDFAELAGVRVKFLDDVMPVPDAAVDLNLLLAEVSQRLNQSDHEAYVDEIVGPYLKDQLGRRYFTEDASNHATNYSAYIHSGVSGEAICKSECIARRRNLNDHDKLVSHLARGVKHGRVFVAIDARHVIPEFGSSRERALFDVLADHGVRVTPIRSARETLNLIE